ncbi:hypothetical protein [Streptomyces sp. NRRL S-1022]|uniref:hypothetical protein n=1 Tax=Streptomyces sp. NRRL S-1022 TaxID=1463880 RepID=UPI0004BF977E|nr:hypothetical protein [Streptomyces sp. NRRL S-1022]
MDTVSDGVDAAPSDDRCRTPSDDRCRTAWGACSPRAAVMAASDRPGSTISTTGDLNLQAPTTIRAFRLQADPRCSAGSTAGSP